MVGVLFDKPMIDLSHNQDFIEYKFYLYENLTSFVSVTIICGLRAEGIPRLQFLPHAVGKVVVVQNVLVDETRRLFVDNRKRNNFKIGVLDLSRYRTDLEPYVNNENGSEKPIALDPPFSMNMTIEAFPNTFPEIQAFRKISNFVRRCQRNVNLVKINPSLAQRSSDFETKFICAKLIVSIF